MDFLRRVCSAVLSIRKRYEIKARQPLSQVTICGEGLHFLASMEETIKDEVNVKKVVIVEDFSGFNIKKIINLDAKTVAKRLGKEFQTVLKQAKQGIFENNSEGILVGGHQISPNEYEVNLQLVGGDLENYASIDGKYLVVLNLEITTELEMEGIARDFIRTIQNARKTANMEITDMINITVNCNQKTIEHDAILTYREFISSQVLATSLEFVESPCQNAFSSDTTFDIHKG